MLTLLISLQQAALPFLQLYTVAAVLMPAENHACPHDTVTLTCVIPRQQSKNLRWEINFHMRRSQSITSIEREFIAGLDHPGLTRTNTNNVGQSIIFTLNSLSPLINSTMTATIQDNPEFRQMSVKSIYSYFFHLMHRHHVSCANTNNKLSNYKAG